MVTIGFWYPAAIAQIGILCFLRGNGCAYMQSFKGVFRKFLHFSPKRAKTIRFVIY